MGKKTKSDFWILILILSVIGLIVTGYYLSSPEKWWFEYDYQGRHYTQYIYNWGFPLIITGVVLFLIIVSYYIFRFTINFPSDKSKKIVDKSQDILVENVKKMKTANYLKVLIVWCALGILLGGYFIIFPKEHKVREQVYYQSGPKWVNNTYSDRIGEIILLITTTGALVIFGFGRLDEVKKNHSQNDR